MALIIEDGSIVANANSYVTLAEARAYALARGVTLPVENDTVETHLFLAMDYLEAQRARYQGTKTEYEVQELQWPRQYVYIDGNLWEDDEIPKELKNAQMQLAIDGYNGITLQPSTSEKFVTREKIGSIEAEYSEKMQTSLKPDLTAAESLLAPLYSQFGGGASLSSIRV